MSTPDTSLSHRQHLVSQIVHNDPELANALFELLVLTDCSDPVGAAAHADALHDVYAQTSECFSECEKREKRIKEGFIPLLTYPEQSHGSVS